LPDFDPTNMAGKPYASRMVAEFAIGSPVN
jgi:hypothetical protein